jgi:hypothetical protein
MVKPCGGHSEMRKQPHRHFIVIRKRAVRKHTPKVLAVKLTAEELERLIEAGAGAARKKRAEKPMATEFAKCCHGCCQDGNWLQQRAPAPKAAQHSRANL